MGYYILKQNLGCLKLHFFQNVNLKLMLLKLLTRFCSLAKRLGTSQGRNRIKTKIRLFQTISFHVTMIRLCCIDDFKNKLQTAI